MALDPKIKGRHKSLLISIKNEFDTSSEEYANFIEHFKVYLPKGLLSTKKTLLEKFEALETGGYLGPGKYDVLKEICKNSGNNDILKLIKEAEEDIRKLANTTQARSTFTFPFPSPSGPRASGNYTATVNLSGPSASYNYTASARSSGSRPSGNYPTTVRLSEPRASGNYTTIARSSGSRTSGNYTTTVRPPGSRALGHYAHDDDPAHKRLRIDVVRQDLLYSRIGDRGYYNNTGKKGLLLILNLTENRSGTKLDVQNLKAFFGPDGLDYEIDDPREGKLEDLTKSQVEAALESLRDKLNGDTSKRYCCFVCFVLSPGNEEGLQTRDLVKPIDEILKSFSNRSIPNFAGRPKLFFIQAYRGTEDQREKHVDNAEDEFTPNAAENNNKDEADETIYFPTDTDTLTSYATTLGRKYGTRSCFITECMKVFTKYHKQDHVEEMLIRVREEVALRFEKSDRTRQMPCVTSTLTHRLMFTKSENSQNIK